MKHGRLNHIGVATAQLPSVAPAKAGAHHVSQCKPTGEIGTSLRWCDGLLVFEG